MILTLVLPGAGINGCVLLGGVYTLYEEEILMRNGEILFNKIRATSVGSVIGCLLIAGYEPVEILEMFEEIQTLIQNQFREDFAYTFHEFMKESRNSLGEQLDSIGKSGEERLGLLSFKLLKEYLEEKIRKKIDISPTFQEFYDLTQTEFTVCVSNLLRKEPIYFSHKTTPDENVLECVLSSSSVPFLVNPSTPFLVDGGVLDNLPLPYELEENETVVVLDIIKTSQVEESNNSTFIESRKGDSPFSKVNFALSLLETIQSNQNFSRNVRRENMRGNSIWYTLELSEKESFSFDLWSGGDKLYELFDFGVKSISRENKRLTSLQ